MSSKLSHWLPEDKQNNYEGKNKLAAPETENYNHNLNLLPVSV